MSAESFIHRLTEALLNTTGTLHGSGDHLSINEAVERAYNLLQKAKRDGQTVFAIGNGGSQVVAQHVEMDLCNRAGMRARSFSSTPVVTALSNDHSHDEAYAMLVESQGRRGDLLIAVSSSGVSPNIIAAAKAARAMGMPVITFTGFDARNALRRAGDLNFWVDSESYGIVELAHETLVHHLSDRCVEAEVASQQARAEAEAKPEVTIVAGLAPSR